MKREPTPKPKSFNSFWPLFFWVECESCGKEFRREPIWRKEIGCIGNFIAPGPGGALMSLPYIYLCTTCAPDMESASVKFLDIQSGDNLELPTVANEINI